MTRNTQSMDYTAQIRRIQHSRACLELASRTWSDHGIGKTEIALNRAAN